MCVYFQLILFCIPYGRRKNCESDENLNKSDLEKIWVRDMALNVHRCAPRPSRQWPHANRSSHYIHPTTFSPPPWTSIAGQKVSAGSNETGLIKRQFAMAASVTHKRCRRSASPIRGPTLENTRIVLRIHLICQNNKKKKKNASRWLIGDEREDEILRFLNRVLLTLERVFATRLINDLKICTVYLGLEIKRKKITLNVNAGLVS